MFSRDLVFLCLFCSIFISSFALRVFVVDKNDDKAKVWSVQLIDPDDSASEQKTEELLSSSVLSAAAPGIAYNFNKNKVFFQARLTYIPGDPYRTLKMGVTGKGVRSINSLCESDLHGIASGQDYTFTVDSDLRLWQGGLDNSTEMQMLMNLSTLPTFMKWHDYSLYYTDGAGFYQIRFDMNETTSRLFLLDESPVLLFTSSTKMNQFDFDPTKSEIMYFATADEIKSVNLTAQPPKFKTFLDDLEAPIGVAVSKDPYYLLYTDVDALYQYDMEEKSTEELEVFTKVYGIAVSSAPSFYLSLTTLFCILLFINLLM